MEGIQLVCIYSESHESVGTITSLKEVAGTVPASKRLVRRRGNTIVVENALGHRSVYQVQEG